MTITHFNRRGTISIPIPRFLDNASSTLSSSVRHMILTFEECTFWDPEIVVEDIDAISVLSKFLGSRRWVQGSYDAGPSRNRFELVVMSGSRLNDTWFKRRNGTSSLPGAPPQLEYKPRRPGPPAGTSQTLLEQLQNQWLPTVRRWMNQDDGNEKDAGRSDETIMNVNLMLIVTGSSPKMFGGEGRGGHGSSAQPVYGPIGCSR